MVIKPLYNERAKRVLQPGELVDFDDEQAALLMERGFIITKEVARKAETIRHRRKHEPQLDRLKDNDF